MSSTSPDPAAPRPPVDGPTGAAHRRGPLQAGDRVQLTDPKGRKHTVVLERGKQFHTHRGWLDHDALIGLDEASVVTTSGGTAYLAVRPHLQDFVLSMPRGATVVYPKDSAAIVGYADVFPGARVLEAGAGSGALSCSLLRAVGPTGRVFSYERREDFAAVARANVERFFGSVPESWTLTNAALEQSTETDVDRVVLDMLAPWDVLDRAHDALVGGGLVCAYVATTTQLSRVVEALRESGRWTEPQPFEVLVRGWHVEGLAVRPDHRMVGHTGFLVTSRRMADGVTAPRRQRRPSKGAYPDPTPAPGELSASGEAMTPVDADNAVDGR